MSDPENRTPRTRWSIQSLLIVLAFLILAAVALLQHRQNLKLQHRLEMLSSKLEHLNASDDIMRARQDYLLDLVRTEPVLNVQDVLNQGGRQ